MKIVGSNRLEHSVLALSIHKSGSTLLSKVIKDICSLNSIAYSSPADYFFSKGINREVWENDPDNLKLMLDNDGVAWCGFRVYGNLAKNYILHHIENQNRKLNIIVLIRDPRDALVSLYYSTAYSHPLPGTGKEKEVILRRRDSVKRMDLDSFCEKQIDAYCNNNGIVSNLESLLNAVDELKNKGLYVSLYRYEDVIFSKYYWVNSLCNDLGLSGDFNLKKNELYDVALRHDIIPKNENVTAHIRSVSPGEHSRKLKIDTIIKLNTVLEPLLTRCGYLF